MTTFIRPHYNIVHLGVARAERVIQSTRNLFERLNHEAGLATLLLTLIALSLGVAVYDIVESSPEGQLLAAWVVFWAAGVALVLGVRKYSFGIYRAWQQSRRDDHMWEVACRDPRIMADINWAQDRDL